MSGLLEAAAEEAEQGSNAEALSKALSRSDKLLTKLEADQELQSILLELMVRLHGSIGEWDRVITSLAAYQEVMAKIHGVESEKAQAARLETLKRVADHGERGTAPAALEALRVRVEKAGLEGKKVWFDVLREQVRVWIKLDDHERALKAGDTMLEAVEHWGARGQMRLNARLMHAAALEFAGRYDEALGLLEQCRLTGIEEKAKESALLSIENRQLLIYETRGDNARGAELMRRRLAQTRARGAAEKLEDHISTLLRLSGFESAAGQHAEALKHASEALDFSRSPAAEGRAAAGLLGRCLNSLADCSSAAGQHEQAVLHAQESRSHALRTGKKNDLVYALEQLAWSLHAAERLEEAFSTWQELERVRKGEPNFKSAFYVLHEMAAIRHEQNRPSEAVEIVRDLWRRCVSHPLGAKDIAELGYTARLGLNYWAAQQKAFPGIKPPAELATWQKAEEVDRTQNTAKGRAPPDKGPSARPERVRIRN